MQNSIKLSKQANKYALITQLPSENQMYRILSSIDSANHRISMKKLEYYVRLWMVKLRTVIDTECTEHPVLQFLPSVRMQTGSNLLNDKYHEQIDIFTYTNINTHTTTHDTRQILHNNAEPTNLKFQKEGKPLCDDIYPIVLICLRNT